MTLNIQAKQDGDNDIQTNHCVRQTIALSSVTFILLFLSTIAFFIDFGLLHISAFMVGYIVFVLYTIFLCNIIVYHLVQQLQLTTSKTDNNNITDIIWKLYEKVKLFSPTFTHFADTSSDVAVLVQFYRNKDNTSDSRNIDYEKLFFVTLFVLFLYRLVSSWIVYSFGNSIWDTILQFFDIYIIKLVGLSVKHKDEQRSKMQIQIQFCESLLESAPQALITLYVILQTANDKKSQDISPIVVVSFVISMLSIIHRAITQDEYGFVAWYVILQ